MPAIAATLFTIPSVIALRQERPSSAFCADCNDTVGNILGRKQAKAAIPDLTHIYLWAISLFVQEQPLSRIAAKNTLAIRVLCKFTQTNA